MDKLINYLKNNLNIDVKNEEFYYEAFTHKSYSNENNIDLNYERLEFLGDSILYKHTTDYIFNNNKGLDEGDMSIMRANFIKGDFLVIISEKLKLNEHIRTGNSKDIKNNKKIIEDIFEALIGAIYLDLSDEGVAKFLNKFYFTEFKEYSEKENMKNPKSILQEFLQSTSRNDIRYEVVEKNKIFYATVYHDDHEFGNGQGTARKEAEVNAAKNALERLGEK